MVLVCLRNPYDAGVLSGTVGDRSIHRDGDRVQVRRFTVGTDRRAQHERFPVVRGLSLVTGPRGL